MSFRLQQRPVTPRSLSPRAPMMPATCVPWPCLSSPEPLPLTKSAPKRSSTAPLPSSSRPLAGSLVFSQRLVRRSGWSSCTPVSSTATFAQLVRLFQAPGASMSWSFLCLIAYCSLTPGSSGLLKTATGPSSSTRSTRSLPRSRARRSSRRDAGARSHRRGAAREQPQQQAAARAVDGLLATLVVGVRAELDEQPGDRGDAPRGCARRSSRNRTFPTAGGAAVAIRTAMSTITPAKVSRPDRFARVFATTIAS